MDVDLWNERKLMNLCLTKAIKKADEEITVTHNDKYKFTFNFKHKQTISNFTLTFLRLNRKRSKNKD